MNNGETLQLTTPTDREVVMTRVFDAPRQLVFDAFTKPRLLERWYGAEGWSLAVCEIDLKVGGSFHFVSRRPDGKLIGQRGVYREVAAPARLVHTEWWEDWNPGECLVTIVLDERDGRTTFTSTVLFPSQDVRDTLLDTGLMDGAAATYDRLAECLASLS